MCVGNEKHRQFHSNSRLKRLHVNQTSERSLHHARQCSRRLSLQALYQWHFNQNSLTELVDQYQSDEYWKKSDHEYFSIVVGGVIKEHVQLDDHINSASEYNSEQIDPIELASLRIATYELIHLPEIPGKVIIAEAIRLCKKFGSNEGYKLVNVILDKLTNQIRTA